MRFGRRSHPRAGRRPTGQPAVIPPPAPDAPREELVPPPASDPWEPVDEVTTLTPELAAAVLRRPELALVPALPAEELEEPAGLPESAAQTLERLTDLWVRQARIAGAGPDATMFYAAAPPPPPPRPVVVDQVVEEDPEPGPPEDFRPDVLELHPPAEESPVPAPTGPARVIRDWASRHDPRSRDYDVRSRLLASVPIQDRVWPLGPVFDQGTSPPLPLRDASGCVGMATAAAVNVQELAAGSTGLHNGPNGGLLTKEDALGLYDRAQDLDHVSGKNYAGTSVLAGMLAAREAGLLVEFLWGFGTRDVAQAVLQVGPVVVGIPWGPSMDSPDAAGVITPGDDLDQGHALAVVGIVTTRAGRPGPFFVLQQSRGTDHGDRGLVYLHHRHLAALLAGIGEAAIPVPPNGLLP